MPGVSPARTVAACLSFPLRRLQGWKLKEPVRPRPRPGFSGILGFFPFGLDSSSSFRALRAASRHCDAPREVGTQARAGGTARAHARCASAARARPPDAAAAHRRRRTLRLRSGGVGRERERRRQRRRRLLKRRRRGSGGRCFCQFRLFVREVDPPLPEQPGGSCGSRGQHRPRLPARASPARHGPGLRPPLQAAHHRRQR